MLLSDVILDLFCAITLRKYNYGWLDTLVHITLSKRWRHNNYTRKPLFGKSIYAVVVVLVKHPKFKPHKFSYFLN